MIDNSNLPPGVSASDPHLTRGDDLKDMLDHLEVNGDFLGVTGPGMSNMDGHIDDGLEPALRANPGLAHGQHSAWNFCGYMWFADGLFRELVLKHGELVDYRMAPSLAELMQKVNDEHGWE